MPLDNARNFAKVTVSTGYNSADTSVVLTTGHGAKFPTAPFYAVWWNFTDYSDPSDDPDVEVVRVTAVATDTLTVVRGQDGTSASNKNTGGKTYKMVAGLVAGQANDIAVLSDIPVVTTGDRGGIRTKFSTTTSAGTTADGDVRYNNSTIASVTNLYVNINDVNGVSFAAFLAQWDDSTSTIKGQLVVAGNDNGSTVLNVFNITGAVTNNTTYYTVPVAYVSGSLPSNATELVAWFVRTGDKGNTGATGSTGAAGADGNTRLSGAATFWIGDSDRTGPSTTTEVDLFGSGLNSASLTTGYMYAVQVEYHIQKTAGSTGHVPVFIWSGTAVGGQASVSYETYLSTSGGAFSGFTLRDSGFNRYINITTALNCDSVNSTDTAETYKITMRWYIYCNTGGTLIPQIKWSAGAGNTCTISWGSFWTIREITSQGIIS